MAKKNRTSYKLKKEVGAELGYTGLSISNGKVREDYIVPLRGPKKIKLLEEMVRFDSWLIFGDFCGRIEAGSPEAAYAIF